MKLTERIKSLLEQYLAPIGTGAMFPYAADTSLRIAVAQDERAMERDMREHSVPELFHRRTDLIDARHQILMYSLGFGTSMGLTYGVLNYGVDRLVKEQDPTVVLATLGALVLGNIASILYERRRSKTQERGTSNPSALFV